MKVRRGVAGYIPLIREYIQFLCEKLRVHQCHPQFNGLFDVDEHLRQEAAEDWNETYATSPIVSVGRHADDAF
jgi:hypothetical protein